MLSKVRSNLTAANLMSAAALFVALGGTSYAVGINTIGSKQIKNGSIVSADIGNGKVAGKDIKNGSLTGGDIGNGKLGGRDIKRGTLTASNFAHGVLPKGPKGDRGSPGATTVHTVSGPQTLCSGDDCTTPPSNAICPTGENLVGGGAYSATDDVLIVSAPTGSATRSTTWQAQTKDTAHDGGANARAVALCAVP